MKQNPHNQSKVNPGKTQPGISKPWLIVTIILIGAIAAYFLWPSAEVPTSQNILAESQTPAISNAEVQQEQLAGKWQRTDGGYVLELKAPTKEGKIEAAYFNPNPIHVGRAAWQNQDGLLKVMVELQDKNYPGSLYTLTYNPGDDQLRGTYFQAMERVSYDVAFTRVTQ
jgi:hypothetical protein